MEIEEKEKIKYAKFLIDIEWSNGNKTEFRGNKLLHLLELINIQKRYQRVPGKVTIFKNNRYYDNEIEIEIYQTYSIY